MLGLAKEFRCHLVFETYMRAVIQRVTRAEVAVANETVGRIERGLVVFLGVAKDDEQGDAQYLADKIANLRIFSDEAGKMNLSVADVQGEILVISQFTLFGDVRRGNRPSFDGAAPPVIAQKLYEHFVEQLEKTAIRVRTGRFREHMEVELVNDGPVTLIIDSKKPC